MVNRRIGLTFDKSKTHTKSSIIHYPIFIILSLYPHNSINRASLSLFCSFGNTRTSTPNSHAHPLIPPSPQHPHSHTQAHLFLLQQAILQTPSSNQPNTSKPTLIYQSKHHSKSLSLTIFRKTIRFSHRIVFSATTLCSFCQAHFLSGITN